MATRPTANPTVTPNDPLGNNTVPTSKVLVGFFIIVVTALCVPLMLTPVVRDPRMVVAVLAGVVLFHAAREFLQWWPDFRKWSAERQDDWAAWKEFRAERRNKRNTPTTSI